MWTASDRAEFIANFENPSNWKLTVFYSFGEDKHDMLDFELEILKCYYKQCSEIIQEYGLHPSQTSARCSYKVLINCYYEPENCIHITRDDEDGKRIITTIEGGNFSNEKIRVLLDQKYEAIKKAAEDEVARYIEDATNWQKDSREEDYCLIHVPDQMENIYIWMLEQRKNTVYYTQHNCHCCIVVRRR